MPTLFDLASISGRTTMLRQASIGNAEVGRCAIVAQTPPVLAPRENA
jgi:hypothetical protein